MFFWNRKYKDSVFTDLFGSDRDDKKELTPEQELRLSDAFYEKDSSKLELVVKI